MSEIICIKLISCHHDNLLTGYFGIEKTWELITRKYYWQILCHNVGAYVKSCDICLASKTIYHKLYEDLQSLLVPTHWWKALSIDFVTGLPISTDWKSDSYNLIFIIIDWLIKMVYYKLIKVTIDASRLAEVIFGMVVYYHNLPNSIVSDPGSVFISKFWSLLCYFFGIKYRLFTAFYL